MYDYYFLSATLFPAKKQKNMKIGFNHFGFLSNLEHVTLFIVGKRADDIARAAPLALAKEESHAVYLSN
jgi:hypothetical protein